MVDPAAVVRHHRERPPVAVAQQYRRHGVGEGDPAGRLAQRGGGGERVGVVARVELVDPQRLQRVGNLAVAARRLLLGPARHVDPAEGGEGAGRGGAELGASSGRTGFTSARPSSALDTIMRCTSMVPDATVAACA